MSLFFVLLVSSCVHKSDLIKNDNAVVVDGLFEFWASSVKETPKKLALRMYLANNFDQPILIRVRDIHCSQDGRWGDLRVLGRRVRNVIWLRPEEVRRLTLVCRFLQPGSGELQIVIGHVFEGLVNGRRERGAVLATDVEWVLGAAR